VLAADEQHANDLIAAVADVPVVINAPGVALIRFSTRQLRARSFAVSKRTSTQNMVETNGIDMAFVSKTQQTTTKSDLQRDGKEDAVCAQPSKIRITVHFYRTTCRRGDSIPSAASPSTGVQPTVSCRVRLLEYNRALQDDDRMTLRQCLTRG